MGIKKKVINFKEAYETNDLEKFMSEVFPSEWQPIVSRVLETGVTYGDTEFTPVWTTIPFTIRNGKTDLETYVKSCIFRVHDVLHQLFHTPIPKDLSVESFYQFKRTWMCAEIAVLTITEFIYCDWLYQTQPDNVKDIIKNRNAIKMKNTTTLKNKSMVEIASRLDGLLHKKIKPKWVRENGWASAFYDDYVKMLEDDRMNIDWNWKLLNNNKNFLQSIQHLPNQIFSDEMDGLELTIWMIKHFEHQLKTNSTIDYQLVKFNKMRREGIIVPKHWNRPTESFIKDYYSKNIEYPGLETVYHRSDWWTKTLGDGVTLSDYKLLSDYCETHGSFKVNGLIAYLGSEIIDLNYTIKK